MCPCSNFSPQYHPVLFCRCVVSGCIRVVVCEVLYPSVVLVVVLVRLVARRTLYGAEMVNNMLKSLSKFGQIFPVDMSK